MEKAYLAISVCATVFTLFNLHSFNSEEVNVFLIQCFIELIIIILLLINILCPFFTSHSSAQRECHPQFGRSGHWKGRRSDRRKCWLDVDLWIIRWVKRRKPFFHCVSLVEQTMFNLVFNLFFHFFPNMESMSVCEIIVSILIGKHFLINHNLQFKFRWLNNAQTDCQISDLVETGVVHNKAFRQSRKLLITVQKQKRSR